MFKFIARNWVILLVIFGLGGTAAVVGVVPGMEGAKAPIEAQIETATGKLVSNTDVQ